MRMPGPRNTAALSTTSKLPRKWPENPHAPLELIHCCSAKSQASPPLGRHFSIRLVSPGCHMAGAKSCPLGTRRHSMSDVALPGSIEPALRKGPDLDKGFHPLTGVIYMGV